MTAEQFEGRSPTRSSRAWVLVAVVFLGILVVPLSLRAINRAVMGGLPPLGYLPSLEIRRPHHPFLESVIGDLKHGQPAWVFIGDSMMGTRIDPIHLGTISSTHDENVGFLYHAATGPAWWYLAFKNHLVASAVKPRAVFIFFRDTNLTDTLFRLEGLYGNALDDVAMPMEPELDAIVALRRKGPWRRIHAGLDRAYQANSATSWMEPAIRRWWVRWRTPAQGAVDAFEWNLGTMFGVDRIRHDVAADIGGADVADVPDFNQDVPTSVLPLIVNLARQHGLTVCFVRVQRRPGADGPPEQSPQLQRYVADLRAWLDANGALFHDDTGDPELTLDLYADGDHVGDRRRYTEIFRKRLDPLFRPLDQARGALSVVEGR